MRRTPGIVVGVVVLFTPVLVLAQHPAQSFEQLKVLVRTGETLWLTDGAGNQIEGRLTQLRTGDVTLQVDGTARTWEESQVREVRHRYSDSLVNGGVIGAATGGAIYAGWLAWWCSEEECSTGEGVAAVALGAGVGTGIGVLVDSLIKGKRTVYVNQAAGPAASIAVIPVMLPGRTELRIRVGF